tara:strand:- start:3062 stop:3328 length:267 start_codon:yes stop_codon:yes gene_type:complete
MKLYRVQAKYKNILLDEMLEAKNDKAALDTFQKKVESGDVTEKDAGGWLNPDILFITFEEVDRDATTKVNIGETSVGVQVGNGGISSG